MWTERGKARLILIFGTNTNREIVAYRSFSLWEVSEKLPQGLACGCQAFIAT